MKKIDKDKAILIICLAIYILINFIFVFYHEPWRDEAHGWLMPKYLSIKELFIESRYDGHPILWYLILMPFAKLNFPIMTANIISLIVMSITAFLLLFKTKIHDAFKIIILFTIPFIYTYTAIARNYCLIVLILVTIGVFYKKRFEKPIIYSILIALLVHTHSLAWGIVAGLTMTFHFFELTINQKKHSKNEIKDIIIGLAIIVLSTLLVVFELYGKRSGGYQVYRNSFTGMTVLIMAIIITITFILSFFVYKQNKKEWFVLAIGYAFQIIIYFFVYSSVINQRFMLVFVLMLFYIILLSNYEPKKQHIIGLYAVYLGIMIIFGIPILGNEIYQDIKYPYSSAKEMANYINEKLPNEDIILVDASIITQTIGVYLDNNNLYDFCNDKYVGCADSVSYISSEIEKNIYKLDSYKGKYVIISNDKILLDNKKIYETKKSIVNEYFTLYYIE